ncbi:hypothetical protein BJ165DRAFT_1524166 [Panaeolus papilionaceus]|nr:hypothetical protein BJ165DRAFT_1524166 [Panaeolus papilionaceus]
MSDTSSNVFVGSPSVLYDHIQKTFYQKSTIIAAEPPTTNVDRIVLTPPIRQTTTPDAAFQGLLLALGVADAAAVDIVGRPRSIVWRWGTGDILDFESCRDRVGGYGTQQDTTEIGEGDRKNDGVSLSTHNAFINRARGPSTIDGILKPNNSSAMPSYRPAPRDPSSLSKGFEAHTCAPPLPPTPQSQYHHLHQNDPSLHPIP